MWGKRLAAWAAAAAVLGTVAGASARLATMDAAIRSNTSALKENAEQHGAIFQALTRVEHTQIRTVTILEMIAEEQGIDIPRDTFVSMARED